MEKKTRSFVTLVLTVVVLCFIGTVDMEAASGKVPGGKDSVADVIMGAEGINWLPKVDYSRLVLNVACPGGVVINKIIEAGDTPYFDLSDFDKNQCPDGSYTYELRVIPTVGRKVLGASQRALTQTGYFMIRGGRIVTERNREDEIAIATEANQYNCICIGNDCQNVNDCTDTLELKETDMRILFDDTSTSAPDNDWGIIINEDDSSGSGEYFAITDETGGTTPFTIEAGAPDNSIYVDDNGNIGIGTSTPGDALEIERTGQNPSLVLERTDGATSYLNARASYGNVGTVSNHPFRIVTNSTTKVVIGADGGVGIGISPFTSPSHKLEVYNESASNAYCDGGDWVNGSSRAYKENIHDLTTNEAVEALVGLNPVKFNYKFDKEEEKLGFIAEDVPNLVAQKDRKGLSPMDVVAVLTKVVQEQQKNISELKEEITALKRKIEK